MLLKMWEKLQDLFLILLGLFENEKGVQFVKINNIYVSKLHAIFFFQNNKNLNF